MEITDEYILKEIAWRKAIIVPYNNSREVRKDYAGAWIVKSQYGKKSLFGWTWIVVNGILMPTHVKNSTKLFNRFLISKISSDGDFPIKKYRLWYL